MAQYPVIGPDPQNIIEVLNYVASGPSGLGQQLAGFNNYASTNLNGNTVLPYVDAAAVMYVARIDLGDSAWIDDYTRQYTFSSVQPAAPFALGNAIIVDNVTPIEFNTPYDVPTGEYINTAIVVECTDSYVIVRDTKPLANPGVTGTGGYIYYFVTSRGGATINTDANADVIVDASNSLVSITAQLAIAASSYAVQIINVDSIYPHVLTYAIELNRYRAVNVGTVARPILAYAFDTTISQEPVYSQTLTAATEGIPLTYTIVSGAPAASSAGVYTLPTGPSQSNGFGAYAGFSINITNDTVDYATGTTVTALGNGGNYAVGDLVVIAGTELGGTTPANDLEMTVATIGGTGDVTIGPFDSVFTTIYDQPASGLYRYILQVKVTSNIDDTVPVTSITVGRRSLTARVVKK
jgi:hypothetical protein